MVRFIITYWKIQKKKKKKKKKKSGGGKSGNGWNKKKKTIFIIINKWECNNWVTAQPPPSHYQIYNNSIFNIPYLIQFITKFVIIQ